MLKRKYIMRNMFFCIIIIIPSLLFSASNQNKIQSYSNSCKTKSVEDCGRCEISCPSEKTAYCSDGIQGSHYDSFHNFWVTFCKKKPICVCKND